MPILPPETSLHPADLLDGKSIDSLPGAWHILHTKPNQEKAVARVLEARGAPFYLPLFKKRSIIRGKEKFAYAPAFRGYFFLCDRDRLVDESDRGADVLSAKQTNRLAALIPVADQQRLHTELRSLRELLAREAEFAEQTQLEKGDYVRVRGGAFDGQEGYVVWRENKKHLLVAITTLQQGLRVELDDCRLEPLGREPEGLAQNEKGAVGRGSFEIGD